MYIMLYSNNSYFTMYHLCLSIYCAKPLFILSLFGHVSAVLQSKLEARRLYGSISRTLSVSGLITSHVLSGTQINC